MAVVVILAEVAEEMATAMAAAEQMGEMGDTEFDRRGKGKWCSRRWTDHEGTMPGCMESY